MKTPVTLRLDPNLLAATRAGAERDSRTLTNLLELVARHYVETTSPDPVRNTTLAGKVPGPSVRPAADRGAFPAGGQA